MDFLEDSLEHSWGKSPKQKAREKEYNAEYYRKNRHKWDKYRSNIDAARGTGLKYNEKYNHIDTRELRKYRNAWADELNEIIEERGLTDDYDNDRDQAYARMRVRDLSDELARKEAHNLRIANRRMNAGTAENERNKAWELANKNILDNYVKEVAAEKYEKSMKAKVDKMAKNASQTISKIASDAYDTVKAGADALLKMFK